MFEDLNGKTAFVTGGARGLGFAMAEALARQGVAIGLVDLLPTVADSAASLTADHGVAAEGRVLDVTRAEDVTATFRELADAIGTPDVLITAAGIAQHKDTLDVTPDDWRTTMEVNLTGTFFACQAFEALGTAESRGRSIICISSMSGKIVNVPQNQAAYNVSKAGVSMLAQSLAVEWAPRGTRVNDIAPGYFLSDMTRQFTEANPAMASDWIGRIPWGRMGEPKDLAGLTCFLASDASEYITAQSIVIDGGYTAI